MPLQRQPTDPDAGHRAVPSSHKDRPQIRDRSGTCRRRAARTNHHCLGYGHVGELELDRGAAAGNTLGWTRRRISHISRPTSSPHPAEFGRSSSPHSPSRWMIGAISLPFGEMLFACLLVTPRSDAGSLEFLQAVDSIDRDINGTPRWRSLKCVLPASNSRTTSGVHRSATTSAAFAIGQNCGTHGAPTSILIAWLTIQRY